MTMTDFSTLFDGASGSGAPEVFAGTDAPTAPLAAGVDHLYIREAVAVAPVGQASTSGTHGGFNVAQSFRANADGAIVAVTVHPGASVAATFRIFDGDGIGGTELHSEPITTAVGTFTINLSTPVAVAAFQTYTWQIDHGGAPQFYESEVGNPYAFGQGYANGGGFGVGGDFRFQVDFSPTETARQVWHSDGTNNFSQIVDGIPFWNRDTFGLRTFDPDPAEPGRHYTLAYSGGSGFTLPPLADAEIGDVITFVNSNGDPATVGAQSGEQLNGAVNGTYDSATAGELVMVQKVAVDNWQSMVLTTPAAVDEFNSNAVVTSTVGTLSFAAGDIVITDGQNVELWFAGPAADSTSIGGATGQYAILLDGNYTTLNMAVAAALQGEDVIYWWDNLAAGDTVAGLGLTVSEVIGAGTLTGNAATADGTGLMGMRIANADGAALILTSTVTTTGAIHLFTEIPAPVPSNLYDVDGTLTGDRTVTMAGNDLTLSGAQNTILRDVGVHDAIGWRKVKGGGLFGTGTVQPDLNTASDWNWGIAGTDVGDLNIQAPAVDPFAGYADEYIISVTNVDSVARNVVFDTHYKDRVGTELGTQIIPAASRRFYRFVYASGFASGSYLDDDYTSGSGLDLGRATTAERDALTGLIGGEHLYNTTSETRQWYHPGSGAAAVASYDASGNSAGGSSVNAEVTERVQSMPAPGAAAEFSAIDLGISSTAATSDVQVTIYDGVGNGGTVLGQATISVPVSAPAITTFQTVNFPSAVQLAAGNQWSIGVVRVAGTGGTGFFLSTDYIAGGGNVTFGGPDDHSMVLTLGPQGSVPAEWRDYPTTSIGEAPGLGSFDASLITHSGSGTYVPNVTNPGTGQISVSDGTIERHGVWATYRFRMEFDQDGLFTLDFAGIIPAGSSIVSAYPWGDAAAEEPFSDVNFNANGTTAIDFNRADSIDADVNYKVTMVVDGYPEVRSLAPNSVTPTPIAYASFQLDDAGSLANPGGTGTDLTSTSSTDSTVIPPATARLPLSSSSGYTVAAEVNGITQGTDDVTVVTAGRYAINGYVQQRGVPSTANSTEACQLIIDGAIAATWAARDASTLGAALPIAWEGDLTVGQVVDLRVRRGGSTTADLYRFNINIRLQPTDSVVVYSPGQVEATALATDFVELGANTGFTAAYSDVLTLDLPEAGRYRVHAKVVAVYDISAAPNRARLFNVTDNTEILGTEINLGDTDVAAGNWRSTNSTERVITVAGPTTVSLQALGGTTGANQMLASTEGNTSLAYERLPTLEVVTPGDVAPVDIGHHRFVASTDNAAGLAGSTAPVSFDSHTTAPNVGNIATFDGTNIVVTAGANPVELKALIHTDGSGSHNGNLYFRDAADAIGLKFGDGAVSGGVSSRGFYGEGSANTMPTAVVPAGTAVTLQVAHSASAASQLVQAGSYIDVREIVGQQQIIPEGALAFPTADDTYSLTVTGGTPSWTPGGGGGGFTYAASGTEALTGDTWFDGKPIYRRYIDTSTIGHTVTLINPGEVDTLIKQFGSAITGGTHFPAPWASQSGAQLNATHAGAGSLVQMNRGGVFATPQAGEFLVLEYTRV